MEKVAVGKIVNTCGLKGEVKVLNLSDFANERYRSNNIINVYSEEKGINESFTISSVRKKDKFIYLKFNEVNSIEEAEKYKECLLIIDGGLLRRINKDTFYYFELMHMEVYFDDKVIGKIIEISDNGRQDLIRVEKKDYNSFLVPFLDEFIEKIDLENKKIFLKNLEGLL